MAIITLAICASGLLLYIYPPLNRWLKQKKDRMAQALLQEGIRDLTVRQRMQNGIRKVVHGKKKGGRKA